MAFAEEVILPVPLPRSSAPRTTQMRGGYLLSSLRALREAGLMERYLAELPPEHHPTITGLIASEWLPIELGISHYAACDRLALPVGQLVDLGLAATKYAYQTIIGVAAKLAQGAGVTPWTIFGQLQRLWDRAFVGGLVGLAKLGPKEARIELVGWPCAQFRYTRIGVRGVARGMAEFFCARAYVNEIEELCSPTTLGMRVSWA